MHYTIPHTARIQCSSEPVIDMDDRVLGDGHEEREDDDAHRIQTRELLRHAIFLVVLAAVGALSDLVEGTVAYDRLQMRVSVAIASHTRLHDQERQWQRRARRMSSECSAGFLERLLDSRHQIVEHLLAHVRRARDDRLDAFLEVVFGLGRQLIESVVDCARSAESEKSVERTLENCLGVHRQLLELQNLEVLLIDVELLTLFDGEECERQTSDCVHSRRAESFFAFTTLRRMYSARATKRGGIGAKGSQLCCVWSTRDRLPTDR